MPLKDNDVRRLVRKLVSWARRLQDSGLCQSCGLQPPSVTASCGHMRCQTCTEYIVKCPCGGTLRDIIDLIILKSKNINFGRKKRSNPKYAANGFQEDYTRDILRLVLLSCYKSRTMRMQDAIQSRKCKLEYTETARKVLITLACRILSSRSVGPLITLLCRMTADRNRYSHLAKVLLLQIISILSRFRSQRRQVIPRVPLCTHCSKESCHYIQNRRHERCTRQYSPSALRTRQAESLFTSDEDRLSMLPLQLKPNYLPILVGTVSVPLMPCPILISPGPVTVMLRRLLNLNEKLVGMALPASQYGTILQICDCVELGDGSFILTTLGLGRFKIIKRVIIQHCLVAKITKVYDRVPIITNLPLNPYIEATGKRILQLFSDFFDKLNQDVKNNILGSYGPLDKYLKMQDNIVHGPAFLWWMTAVLPLSDELKVHLISCEYIHKRMAIIQDALIKANIIYQDINRVENITN